MRKQSNHASGCFSKYVENSVRFLVGFTEKVPARGNLFPVYIVSRGWFMNIMYTIKWPHDEKKVRKYYWNIQILFYYRGNLVSEHNPFREHAYNQNARTSKWTFPFETMGTKTICSTTLQQVLKIWGVNCLSTPTIAEVTPHCEHVAEHCSTACVHDEGDLSPPRLPLQLI